MSALTGSSIRRWISAAFSSSRPRRLADAVEVHVPERPEERRPVDLTVADLVVLVDPGVHAQRVDDGAVADVGPVVVAVGDVDVRQLRSGVLQHPAHVARPVGGWKVCGRSRRT